MDIVQAIPVIIGGILALIGGMSVQWMTHHFAGKREREKILLEKAEKLVNVIYAHQGFILNHPLNFLYGITKPIADPINEILALQTLYFPSLQKEMQNLRNAMDRLNKHLFEESLKRSSPKDREWLKTHDEQAVNKLMFECKAQSDALIEAVARTIPSRARR